MIFVLVLKISFGYAIVGDFATEPECEAAGKAYAEVLATEKAKDNYQPKLKCFKVTPPSPVYSPREMWNA